MLIIGTTFFMLVDGTKQAGPVGCSGIHLSKLYPIAIFSSYRIWVPSYILIDNSGKVFYLAVMMLYVTMPATNKLQLYNK